MILGASAGSTCGVYSFSYVDHCEKDQAGYSKAFASTKVEAITMDGKVVDTEIVNQILAYFCSFFIIIVVIIIFLVSLNNLDFETTQYF